MNYLLGHEPEIVHLCLIYNKILTREEFIEYATQPLKELIVCMTKKEFREQLPKVLITIKEKNSGGVIGRDEAEFAVFTARALRQASIALNGGSKFYSLHSKKKIQIKDAATLVMYMAKHKKVLLVDAVGEKSDIVI